MYCGFDIGGTKVLAPGGERGPTRASPVAERRAATVADGDALIATIEEMADALEAECGAAFSAVGVGIAGLVDAAGVLKYSPNIDGVLDLDVRRRLRARLQRPVVVENEATARGLG